MLCKFKDLFSLRDKNLTCPNIKVGTDVTDISTICIRPYHVKKEDKVVLDKEMKRLHYLETIKDGFCSIFKSSQFGQ